MIGGGISARGDSLFGPLRQHAEELIHLVPVPAIHPAGLGQDSGIIGALVLAETSGEG